MSIERDVERADTAPAPEDREKPPPGERANLPALAVPGTAMVTPLMPQPTEPAAPVGPPPEKQPFREPRRQPNPPPGTRAVGDVVFNAVTAAFASLILVILGTVIVVLVLQSRLSIQTFGFGFLVDTVWDPIVGTFGARSAIVGTVYTSLLALLFAAPVGLMVAMFLTEMAPRLMRFWLGFIVELLAAVPSIVYGLWALFILVPFVRDHLQTPLSDHFGNTPLFSGYPLGLGFLTAALILSIMILPTIAAISRDVMLAVPNAQRDAMLALGATRWETTWKVVVPYARSGIVGAIVLAFGRAIGETMAVQMVIGNNLQPTGLSLLNTGMTMPSLIVTQFQEATTAIHQSALIELALILMVVTLLLNTVARLLVWRMTHGPAVQV
jgi:phosphate transport system permease protein